MRWLRPAALLALVALPQISCRDTAAPVTPLQRVSSLEEGGCTEQTNLRLADASVAALQVCENEPIVYTLTPGLPLSETWATCTAATAANDTDRDGVTDACEQEVASAFGPYMNQPLNEIVPIGESMLPGEYYHGVNKLVGTPQTLRLIFIPGYFWDLGGLFDPAEPGDGEFFVIDVEFRDFSSRWYTVRAAMSQHGDWPWYNVNQLEFKDNRVQGTPLVYVADRKHAHYPTDRDCDNGADFLWDLGNWDACSGPRALFKYPVDPAFNIGSLTVDSGNQPARRYHPPGTFNPSATENMWGWDFCGWQGCESSGGFRSVLEHYGFGEPYVIPPPTGTCPTYGPCPIPELRSGAPAKSGQPVAGLSVRPR